jgi:hypothetical protein
VCELCESQVDPKKIGTQIWRKLLELDTKKDPDNIEEALNKKIVIHLEALLKLL